MIRTYKKGNTHYIEINDTLKRPKVKLELLDPKGKVVKKVEYESKSYVRNFVNYLYAIMTSYSASITKLDGATISIDGDKDYPTSYWNSSEVRLFNAGAGDDNPSYGIVVGSGTTPASPTDYKLESQISHGTGDGLLDYQKTTSTISIGETTASSSLIRDFWNLGSVDVSVNEVGIIVYHRLWFAGNFDEKVTFLIIRDVLPATFVVPPLYGVRVSYTWVFPADQGFTEWFIKMFRGSLIEQNPTVTKTDGSTATVRIKDSRSAAHYIARWGWVNSGDNDTSYGIILGSSNASFAYNQYNAQSMISHGTGSGQVDYDYHTVSIEDLADKWRLKITRIFRNLSGGDIIVREVCLVGWYRYKAYGIDMSAPIMFVRRVISDYTFEKDTSLNVNYYIAIPK